MEGWNRNIEYCRTGIGILKEKYSASTPNVNDICSDLLYPSGTQ